MAVRQSWTESTAHEPEVCARMKRFARCNPCCPTDGVIGDEDGIDETVSQASGSSDAEAAQPRVTPSTQTISARDEQLPPNFMRLGPDNPWWVCRSPDHGGKLFWMHRTTHETTWKQPLPRLDQLPKWSTVHSGLRDNAFAVVDPIFYGAPTNKQDAKARTGICGSKPEQVQLRRTCETLSIEHHLYPKCVRNEPLARRRRLFMPCTPDTALEALGSRQADMRGCAGVC